MKITKLVLTCALTFVTVGCGTESTPAPAPSPDGVTLQTATKERLTGSYTDGTATVKFDSARTGDDLYLDLVGQNGLRIIHIETTPTSYEFSYLGGKLMIHASKDTIAAARAAQDPSSVSPDGFVFDGDRAALDEMLQLPEVHLLPQLSRALGVRGLTGTEYPSSYVLHKIARQSADALGIDVAPIQLSSQAGYCQDLRSDPYGNGCYGMCGPGCSCWSWVCGDCCYHYGCAVHDNWCRQGQWYYCYNITAVIALFGC